MRFSDLLRDNHESIDNETDGHRYGSTDMVVHRRDLNNHQPIPSPDILSPPFILTWIKWTLRKTLGAVPWVFEVDGFPRRLRNRIFRTVVDAYPRNSGECAISLRGAAIYSLSAVSSFWTDLCFGQECDICRDGSRQPDAVVVGGGEQSGAGGSHKDGGGWRLKAAARTVVSRLSRDSIG